MRLQTWMMGLVLACLAGGAVAGVIGYDERFALAEDRADALKELIPGTEEFYYYHALHYQNQGDFAKAQGFLDAGIKKFHHTTRLSELENRQMLLQADTYPDRAYAHLRRRLGLTFSHRQKELKPEVRLPVALNPQTIDTRRLVSAELRRESRHVGGFEDAAFDMLLGGPLTDAQRRSLLSRVRRPDHDRMVDLVLADLNYRQSGGFGSQKVHAQLTIPQLEKLLEAKPELIGDSRWVQAYLTKLRPTEDENVRDDDKAFDAYLTRLEAFVKRLPPSQNSLRANVLYQRLAFNRKRGDYDKALLMAYIQLPRPVPYVNSKWLGQRQFLGARVNLSEGFFASAALPPIGQDEELVRDYFAHILVDEESYEAYTTYIESEWLKRVFAETKLLAGVGDAAAWYALLSPEHVRRLRDRVDIELLPTNKPVYLTSDKVRLDVAIKNVDELLVKVFHINTEGYYRRTGTEVTTGIELDGLVANAERTVSYSESPIRRHAEALEFPEIEKPGTYVIELIGNGYSSRALIRKGRLTYTERVGSAGHAFRVYDELGQPVDADVTMWLAGREFPQDERGEIHVPFSGNPGQQSFVLSHNGFAALGTFNHLGESYRLDLNAWLPREGLVAGRTCEVACRPELTLNGEPVALGLIEKPQLVVRSYDLDGMNSEKRIPVGELADDAALTFDFRVPERLRRLDVTLSGTVRNMAAGTDVPISANSTVAANGINETRIIGDLFLRRVATGYFLELLGRDGEVLADRPVDLWFKNHFLKREQHVSLKSGPDGRIWLGELPDVDRMRVSGPEQVSHSWSFGDVRCSDERLVQAEASDVVRIAMESRRSDMPAAEVSLLETRGGVMVRDCIDKVSLEPGFVVIRGLEPGDYSLLLKRDGREVALRVTAGNPVDGQIVGATRVLETRGGAAPLQITDAQVEGDELVVQLAHATSLTRVHVAASRFELGSDLFAALGVPAARPLTAAMLGRPVSQYLSGRDIGDEYRYVMERRHGDIFVGNMLTRPSLLLNPWSPRETETATDQARAGEAYDDAAAPAVMRGLYGSRSAGSRGEGRGQVGGIDFSCVDLLREVSGLLVDLVPDKDGAVRIPIKALGAGQSIQIYAVDGVRAVQRKLALPEREEVWQDLRLTRYLDPDGHFSEQRKASIVRKGEAFRVADLLSAKFEIVDTLGGAYRLLSSLHEDATLGEFSFVLDWPTLDEERRLELYKRYACHELHLFLYRKDPAFFRKVVAPYLACKKDPTFMDEWLLGKSLDGYLEPWQYARLNIAERALLGQSVAAQQAGTARHISDLYDLVPLDLDAWNRRFDATLRSSGLEERGDLSDVLAAAEAGVVDDVFYAKGGSISKAAMYRKLAANSPAPTMVKDVAEKKRMGAKEALMRKMAERREESLSEMDAVMDVSADSDAGRGSANERAWRMEGDKAKRMQQRQFFRKLEKTREWVENNYYHQLQSQQNAAVVPVDAFWRDLAAAGKADGFLSGALPEASHSFTEMLLALAMIDLPFEAAEHAITYDNGGMLLVPGSDLLVFHKQIMEAQLDKESPRLLVTQNFFAADDRYRHEGNERLEKFVTGDIEARRVYGCQVVLTNPTSTRRKVDLIRQIPAGSMPVEKGLQTRSEHLVLEPYTTQQREFVFYFPHSGDFPIYPVHIAQNGKVVGVADGRTFHVVDEVNDIDKESWEHISQFGTQEDVLAFLDAHNIDRLDLGQIAWRMRDKAYFGKVLALLHARHVYSGVLWSYGIYHKDPAATRRYLPTTSFASQCGLVLDSPLLTLDPIERVVYEHKEYWPLVNARIFKLGKERKILNEAFYAQYEQFMKVLTYRPALTDEDRMALVVYMLLQDRVGKALAFFDEVDAEQMGMKVQYDFMAAYLSFYREDPKKARKLARGYKDYPVERWRNLFREVLAQCDEIEGKSSGVVDEDSRDQVQGQLAMTDPQLTLEIQEKELRLDHANLSACTLKFYPMDIELLFSRQPFVQDVGEQVTVIEPAHVMHADLKGERTIVPVPAELAGRNMVVEASAAGLSSRAPYYPNAFRLDVMENYGQLKVSDRKSGKPLGKVYVKVYARTSDGRVIFFKDGYTDLRGRFDYASLNTNEIEDAQRFAILVMSETHGSVVREATPPKR